MKVSKKKEAITRRPDWDVNHENIKEAFLRLLKENSGKRPSFRELSNETGLHVNTISKHVKGLTIEMDGVYKLLTEDVVISIYKAAVKGNVSAMKLWFQVVNGWVEPSEVIHSGELNTNHQPPVIVKITSKGSESRQMTQEEVNKKFGSGPYPPTVLDI